MAGRKQVTDEEFDLNKKMIEIGKADGALEAKRALETVVHSHQMGVKAGRAQAFGAMKLIAEFLEWKSISQIIDDKEFLNIQVKKQGVTKNIKTVEEYLEHLGFSGSAGFRNLKIVRSLTPTEIQLLSQVGFTRKDLLGYASLSDEARMEIREGKVINLEKAGREEIREVIEQVLQESRDLKEEATKTAQAKDRVLGQKEEMINRQAKEIVKLEGKLDRMAIEMEIPADEVAYCKEIEELDICFKAYLGRIRALVECDVPGPTAALRLVTLLNRLRMEANHWYQDAYDVHAPANSAPEEEWTQPE